MTPRLLRLKDVVFQTGMSQSWIYAEMAEGRFPKPTRVGPKAMRWIESEIALWVEAQIEKRKVA